MRILIFSTLVLCSAFAQASYAPLFHEANPQEKSKAIYSNRSNQWMVTAPQGAASYQPVADTAAFSYVLMSAETQNLPEVQYLRQTIASHLPAGVKLVILASPQEVNSVRAQYSKWISPDRLIIASSNDQNVANGFWARDSFPVPVTGAGNVVSLVAAHYYRDFNSSAAIDQSVGSPKLIPESFTFVGGDLIADANGTCFSVQSDRQFGLSPAQIQQAYGCKQLHLLAHVAGIGDVDEVMKPLSPTLAVTNQASYQAELQSWGYKVVMLPDIGGYRTYANALIVGKTAFMPSYGVSQDAQAEQVYQSLGYTVYPIPSNDLSDDWHGSVHCQTMAYPAMSVRQLMRTIDAHVIE